MHYGNFERGNSFSNFQQISEDAAHIKIELVLHNEKHTYVHGQARSSTAAFGVQTMSSVHETHDENYYDL